MRSAVARVAVAMAVAAGLAARAWDLGRPLIWDEARDGAIARLPVGRMFDVLRAIEVHPPGEYLLRAPVARLSSSEALLRAPTVVASCAAVVVFAWWLRRCGVLGGVAVSVFALTAYQFTYARQARPYGVVVLVGVAVGALTARWLRDRRTADAIAVSLLALLGAFLHESALFLLPGLLLVPGRDGSHAAWRWRALIVASGAVWLIAWGPSFADQLRFHEASEVTIPFTSVDSVIRSLNEVVDYSRRAAPLTFVVLVGGAVALYRRDRRLWWTLMCTTAVPILVAAAVGLQVRVFWPKSLAMFSWGASLAIASAVAWAWERWRVLGVAAGAAAALLVLPSAWHELTTRSGVGGWEPVITSLADRVEPGDVVATRTPYLSDPILWYATRGHAPAASLRGAYPPHRFTVRGAPATGRMWEVYGPTSVPSRLEARGCGTFRANGFTAACTVR